MPNPTTLHPDPSPKAMCFKMPRSIGNDADGCLLRFRSISLVYLSGTGIVVSKTARGPDRYKLPSTLERGIPAAHGFRQDWILKNKEAGIMKDQWYIG